MQRCWPGKVIITAVWLQHGVQPNIENCCTMWISRCWRSIAVVSVSMLVKKFRKSVAPDSSNRRWSPSNHRIWNRCSKFRNSRTARAQKVCFHNWKQFPLRAREKLVSGPSSILILICIWRQQIRNDDQLSISKFEILDNNFNWSHSQ